MLLEMTASEHELVRRHYRHAMDVLVKHFGGTPIGWMSYPTKLGIDAVYHKDIEHAPKTIHTVPVRTSTGTHPYVALDAHNLTWLVAGRFAVDLIGWSPTSGDPERAAFARLVLSPQGTTTDADAIVAAHLVREALDAEGFDAMPMLDGFRGLTLWIPFDDAPSYDDVAPWLRGLATTLVAQHPETLTLAQHVADRGNRVELGTKSNHPGMGSALPYSLRGTPSLEVALPVGWSDLGSIHNGEITAATFHDYLKTFGDVFERERLKIASQSFGTRAPAKRTKIATFVFEAPESDPHGYIISAALTVLADGAEHDADDILTRAQALGLLPSSTSRKYVYTALHEYIERTRGAGREPEFVQVAGEATFRLNRPVDPWPNAVLPALPTWLSTATIAATTAALRTTATGGDPTAFELATTNAFARLGFVATHVGGNGAPDVTLIAPLGTRAYRAIVECKSASPGGVVANPRPEEPARFRDAVKADFAILVGPAFTNDAALDDELHAHTVSLWTVDDLVGALDAQIGPDEFRMLLIAGRVAPALQGLLWERDHGDRKHVAVVGDLVHAALWKTQYVLAEVGASTAPHIDRNTIALLADEALVAAGLTTGATPDVIDRALTMLVVVGRIAYSEEAGYVALVPPLTA